MRERTADAIEKEGRAEAVALREKGFAEAETLREKLKGEAEGLQEKAKAMAALDDATREHEEFRLRVELEKEVELAMINALREVAEAQARVLATGLESANIEIVGGDSIFLDRIVGSIGLGKGLDQLIGNSEVGKTAATALIGRLAGLNGSDDGERATAK